MLGCVAILFVIAGDFLIGRIFDRIEIYVKIWQHDLLERIKIGRRNCLLKSLIFLLTNLYVNFDLVKTFCLQCSGKQALGQNEH